MADGSAVPAARGPASGCRGARRCGCGLALGRLVRKLRRQSKMLCAATAGARHTAAAGRCQYDPLSYARNFDFGPALDGDDGYSFASRFVLAASARQPQ